MSNMGTTYSSSELEGYGDLNLYPEEAPVLTLVKGILGALIGALPGMALWIIIGKAGYIAVACGLLLAIGTVVGYSMMTKKGDVSPVIGIIICILAIAFTVYLAERIVWSWEIMDLLDGMFEEWRDTAVAETMTLAKASGYDVTESEVRELCTYELFQEALAETFGFSEITFSSCFYHFDDILEAVESKGSFAWSLGKSYICAAAGGIGALAKFKK